MVSPLQWWARLFLGVALAFAVLGFLIAMGSLALFTPNGDTAKDRAMGVLDVLSQTAAVLAMLANLLAFSLAVGCWLKGAKVPWVVLAISSLGLCYCLYFVLAMLGVMA